MKVFSIQNKLNGIETTVCCTGAQKAAPREQYVNVIQNQNIFIIFQEVLCSIERRFLICEGRAWAKLSEAMLNVLLQLPMGLGNLKEVIIANLGLIGQMASTRDLNEAWTQTKKKAAKLYPDKFILDGRNNLIWNDGTVKVVDKNISPANFKKLNELAIEKDCSVNTVITKLLKAYSKDVG